jgi:hypothetical protein
MRCAALGAHWLDVEIFSCILAADMDVFAAIREDLLLRIMARVDAAGTQVAFPSVGPLRRKGRGVGAHSETCPPPDFEWQSKAKLGGSLD